MGPSVPAVLLAFPIRGAILACNNIPINALVQTQVTGELLGRATTVLGSLLSVAQPIAAASAGTLAALTSIGYVLAGSGVAVILSLVSYPFFRELRRANY